MLTANAEQVLSARYLRTDGAGHPVETPEEMFRRVAAHVAAVESRFGEDVSTSAAEFHAAMSHLEFLPNSPTLMNAGTPVGQLAACFVLPVEDTLDGIFTTLHDAALIQQTGGGVGYDFSPLRPAGERVTSTGGFASGPVPFIAAFDAAVEAVRQGGRRRGANMAVLDVHHADVEAFVAAKRATTALRNFNLSVAVDDAFMRDAANGVASAAALLRLMAVCAWEGGDPGLLFVDRVNRDNPLPALGRITATNPCGEVPLRPYEACVLGSINLAALSGNGSFDWDRLDALTALGVRFLDDCIDASTFPLPRIAEAACASRKIGLGVMGFADALIDLDIAYDAAAAVCFAGDVMARMAGRANEASEALARRRGAYPDFPRSRDAALGRPPLRNATRLAIAPTGSLSLIAGCSSGIEPLFAVACERHVLDGVTLRDVNRRFERWATRAGVWTPELRDTLVASGRVRDLSEVPPHIRRLFPTAHEISPAQHLRIQAACQEHVDNAVSKTINLPASARVADVEAAYQLACDLGCKGITVYRDGTRAGQVLRCRLSRTSGPPSGSR